MKMNFFILFIIGFLTITVSGIVVNYDGAVNLNNSDIIASINTQVANEHRIGNFTDMVWYDNTSKYTPVMFIWNSTYITNLNGTELNSWAVPIILILSDNSSHLGQYLLTAYVTDDNPNYPDGTILNRTLVKDLG
ncbi:MAG: hypothetical protein LBT10_08945 [Methanobrevibacter sp.]|nr:hypothetical protein [Methanobrevibacter sp.]